MPTDGRAWLTGNTLAGSRGRVLVIPGDINFLMAVNGALLPLIYPQNWVQFGTVTPDDAAAAMQAMYLEYLQSEVILPVSDSEISIFPGLMAVAAGNPIVNTINASARGNYISQQSPNANGNQRETFRYMQAGTWQWRLTAATTTTGCSLTFQINAADGTILIPGTLNLRTASTVFNTVFSGSFSLPVSGLTRIGFGVSPGTTGGFQDILQMLEMWRT